MQPNDWVTGTAGVTLWILLCVWYSIAEKNWKYVGYFAVLPILAGLALKGLA